MTYSILKYQTFKKNPEEIALQNKALRQEVAQSEKFNAMATLASGLAHEIKNPLTVLKTFFQYYPKKKDDPQFLKKFNQITGRELQRIEDLVRDLMDFAKPEPPVFKPVDIHQVIRETIDLVQNDIDKHNIQLNLPLTCDRLSLTADKNQLKQALLNIILNAIEVMPEGGTLTVGTSVERKKGANVNSSLPHSLLITIKDTGQGIAKENLKHIFEPFFTKKDRGTSLGLAITQGIIEKHGGKIKVESQVSCGTCFIITIPLKRNYT